MTWWRSSLGRPTRGRSVRDQARLRSPVRRAGGDGSASDLDEVLTHARRAGRDVRRFWGIVKLGNAQVVRRTYASMPTSVNEAERHLIVSAGRRSEVSS